MPTLPAWPHRVAIGEAPRRTSPRLVEVLTAQQHPTGYPVRWPLPFPVEQFLVRTSEGRRAGGRRASGRPPRHVAVLDVAPGWDADGWTAGTGMPAGSLAVVGVLFVDPTAAGRGVGTALLSTAVETCVIWPSPGAGRGEREHPRSRCTSGTAGGSSAPRGRRGCPTTATRCCSWP